MMTMSRRLSEIDTVAKQARMEIMTDSIAIDVFYSVNPKQKDTKCPTTSSVLW